MLRLKPATPTAACETAANTALEKRQSTTLEPIAPQHRIAPDSTTRMNTGIKRPHAGVTHIGATEDQVNMAGTVPERIDKHGTKIEEIAGTGQHDSLGG